MMLNTLISLHIMLQHVHHLLVHMIQNMEQKYKAP